MPKDPRRKGRLRPQPRILEDPDLIHLASVLSEYQLDNNAYGWFRPAWRNGEWAIGLATAAAYAPGVFDGDRMTLLEEASIKTLIESPQRDGAVYERADAFHRALIQPKVNTNTARLLAAALRCLQLKIANSHGGGAVYNEVLIPAFLPIRPPLVEDLVLDFRCNDAIGTSRQLRNDRNDRQRSAFTTAWKRGLYLAAYSIQPVQ